MQPNPYAVEAQQSTVYTTRNTRICPTKCATHCWKRRRWFQIMLAGCKNYDLL